MWGDIQRCHRGDDLLYAKWRASRYGSLSNSTDSRSLHQLTLRIGPAFEKNVKGRLYPVVGMTAPAALTVNFGNNVESRPFKWELGNSGKYDADAVKLKKDEGPVTVPVPIEFGISKPPV